MIWEIIIIILACLVIFIGTIYFFLKLVDKIKLKLLKGGYDEKKDKSRPDEFWIEEGKGRIGEKPERRTERIDKGRIDRSIKQDNSGEQHLKGDVESERRPILSDGSNIKLRELEQSIERRMGKNDKGTKRNKKSLRGLLKRGRKQ